MTPIIVTPAGTACPVTPAPDTPHADAALAEMGAVRVSEPAPVSVREAARVLLAYMDKPEFARVADKVGEVKRRSFEGEFTVALRTIAEGKDDDRS